MAALLLLCVVATCAGARLGDVSRKDTGDLFTLTGDVCGAAQCSEHGAGVAGEASEECPCACPQRAPLFREDRELCVDDLPECSLATFGTGVGVQKIPFVFLPLKGQIIHPSREITFRDVKTPICAVSGAQFLTRKGFLDLRNTLDADVPFSLFRDEGRTFLQWTGEDDVRARMSGRVMLVRLLCRDVTATPASPVDLRGVFTPCVAFKVQGSPPRHVSNVTEVQFAPNAQTSEASSTSGLSVTEYVAIGISSLLLGLIYVASVFLFLHIRKRKKASETSSTRKFKGLKKKDGSVITERDIVRIANERITLPNSMDDGVVKKNPLLTMGRQFNENKGSFPSDSGSVSDSEDLAESSVRSEDNVFNSSTKAMIHLQKEESNRRHDMEMSHRDESNIERLPDEHVSIVETTDDREIARPVGTTRRKLYFNPAYFEPQLMAAPPPAALEFLVKIREVIAIAKHKMAAKRFQPVLNRIPEEESYPSNGNSIELYQGLGSQRSGSVMSLKRENSRKKSCLGCPGCKSDTSSGIQNFMKFDVPACTNCLNSKGDKQNSIRQWLENIPLGKQQPFYNDLLSNQSQNSFTHSMMSLPISESRVRKQNVLTPSSSMYLPDSFSLHKKSSTMSVRSEPPLRSFNLPLPEFKSPDIRNGNFSYHCQTVSRIDDIRPIGLSDYRSGSLRSNNISHRRNAPKNSALPDMVNEAMALDHSTKSYHQSSSEDERSRKTINCTRNSMESSCNDYETDSLERASHKKRISTPSDIGSSQASPSLSNALPLEEELTIRNDIYKTISSKSNTPSPQREARLEHNIYETISKDQLLTKSSPKLNSIQGTDYSLVSEVYVNNNYNFGSTPTSPSGSECSMGSRKFIQPINNDLEKPGCLTIEVKDSPENYIKIHESDGFEPDTLDRKHPKHNKHPQHPKQIAEPVHFSRKDLLKNIDKEKSPPHRIQLRSSGTFTKKIIDEHLTKFNSLRNEYEHRAFDRPRMSPTTFSGSKSLTNTEEIWNDPADWNTEEGRILTLELRHSKRQRQSTPPTIKQLKTLARPDVLPPLPPTDDGIIYEQPNSPPRKVEHDLNQIDINPKNVKGRSLSPRTFTKNRESKNKIGNELQYGPSCSPMRSSVYAQSSEYENMKSFHSFRDSKAEELCRNYRRSVRSHSVSGVNSNTFVKERKDNAHNKSRFRRKKGVNIEDSGYLSSDSTGSRRISRKLVVAKIVSCSESDDTENEARSESGAESVETHSVYFGSFRVPQNDTSFHNKSVI